MVKLVFTAFVIGVLVGIAIWHLYHTVVIGKIKAAYNNLINKALNVRNALETDKDKLFSEIELEFNQLKSKL